MAMRQANNATFWDRLSQLSANLFHLASSVFSIPFQFLQQLYINVRLKILPKVQPTHQYIMKPTYNYQQERDHALQELISCYGEKHPLFFNGSLSQALKEARDQYRFLLVYVHCSEHQYADNFCRDVLFNNEDLSDYINQHFILWVADVKTTEGINCALLLGTTTYPHLSIVNSTSPSNDPLLLAHIMGRITSDELKTFLNNIIGTYGHLSFSQRILAEERETNQKLREEQEAAFRAALLADQHQQTVSQSGVYNNNAMNNDQFVPSSPFPSSYPQSPITPPLRSHNNNDDQFDDDELRRDFNNVNNINNNNNNINTAIDEDDDQTMEIDPEVERQQRIEHLTSVLGDEPASSANIPNALPSIQLAFQLPTGIRLRRRFLRDDLVQKLYDFVELEMLKNNILLPSYELSSNFPRKVYAEKQQTVDQSQIPNNVLLYVVEC